MKKGEVGAVAAGSEGPDAGFPVAPRREQFEAVDVTEQDLDDLAGFTGMSREECLERLRSYSPEEMAEAWRRADPRTPEEMLDFYRSADLYIWDLLQWHRSPARRRHWEDMEELVQRFPPSSHPRAFEFGSGIGTDALFLASRGYDVTLVDVGSPAFRFAEYRFAQRGLPAHFVESRSPLPEPGGTFDLVMCFDVFEHVPDPLHAARRLVDALRTGGVFVQEADFVHDHAHPQHLPEAAHRFESPRWHIHLTGLGLQQVTRLAYRRVTGWRAGAVRARYALWRGTGVWMMAVDTRSGGRHHRSAPVA